MAVRLSTMLAQTAETVVKFAGEDILVCYRPNVVTLELSDQIDAQGAAADEALKRGEQTHHDWVTAQLEPLLEWWDVLDENDQRVEPTVENMRKFPVNFLTAVLRAITADQQVEPGESEGSDVG